MNLRQYIKAMVVLTGISFYMIFQYEFITNKVKLNEEYFIVTSLCMAFFAFMSIEKKDNVFVKCLIILFAVFFVMLDIVYIHKWVIQDNGKPVYYTALCISAIITFLYLIYTVIEKYLKRLYNVFFGRKQFS